MITASDVKLHDFFGPEIFHEIFLKYFKKFTMLLNNGQHRSKYTQYKQTNRQIYRSCSFQQIYDLGRQQLQSHGHYGPVGWRHLAGAEPADDHECIDG